MPMYAFYDENNDVMVDRFFKLNQRPDSIVEDGIEYKYVLSAPAIVSGTGGIKVPSNLKDRLNQIKKQHPEMRSSVV